MTDKTYYVPHEEYFDSFYGGYHPVCVDYAELCFLAVGWGMALDELLNQVRRATPEDIALYGLSE